MRKRSIASPLTFGSQTGFTYIGVLFAVALIGLGLTCVSEIWAKVAEREKLAQLKWAGNQYANAIRSYYYANTGYIHQYPQRFDQLLEDNRYLSLRRHIRKLYANPITQASDWGVIQAADGGIMGVTVQDPYGKQAMTFTFKPPPVPSL
jgi:type II secretory pathway pseudopilin PulG